MVDNGEAVERLASCWVNRLFFPQHTVVKLSRILDPAKDPQPRYMDTGAYIEVKPSDISAYSDMCIFRTRTPKGTSSFQGRIYYFPDGTVGRTESFITRNTYRDFVVKSFVGGRFDTSYIKYIYDSKYGVVYKMSGSERRRIMTEKSRWEKVEREERERRIRQQKAADRKRKRDEDRAERAAIAQQRRERSEEIDCYIVEHYNDSTQREIATALGITTKAVERRVSKLRQKGRLPLYKGSNVYIDAQQAGEESSACNSHNSSIAGQSKPS